MLLAINQGHKCILLLADLEANEGLNGGVRDEIEIKDVNLKSESQVRRRGILLKDTLLSI